jgi:uncharacterized UPF0160 family protein
MYVQRRVFMVQRSHWVQTSKQSDKNKERTELCNSGLLFQHKHRRTLALLLAQSADSALDTYLISKLAAGNRGA